ncbi:Las1-like-domain-containing protein [Syncephalis plumigaleata]|nr:Las1-like-domain-containing protein [Syncephalis plumigaleata]
MPSWFVELRHAGTHEQLPSLSILRTTCGQALHWLYNSYWSVQRSNLQETMNELRPLLLEYKTYRKKSLKANKVSKQRFGVKVDRLLQSIVGHIDMNTFEDTLIPILLEPGCLVPMGKTKRATLPEVQLTEEICQIWTMALGHFNHIWYNANFLEVLTQAMLYQLYDTADNAAISSTTADPSKPKSVSYTWTLGNCAQLI